MSVQEIMKEKDQIIADRECSAVCLSVSYGRLKRLFSRLEQELSKQKTKEEDAEPNCPKDKKDCPFTSREDTEILDWIDNCGEFVLTRTMDCKLRFSPVEKTSKTFKADNIRDLITKATKE